MSTSSTPNFSSVITALRFPLILFVVAIHLVGEDLRLPQWGTSDWFYLYTTEFISHSLARIAVPMFFFISGYYAFYKKDWSQRSVWTAELKKRVKTLLVPYLLWNSLYIIILLSKTQLETRLGSGPHDPFYLTSIPEFLSYYWNEVIVYPLWYLRDLIVLCALSPILYRLITWSRGYILLPLFVCFLMAWECSFAEFGFGTISFFCFMFGGYLSIKQIDPLEKLQRVKYIAGLIALVTVFILPLLSQWSGYKTVESIYILTGSASALLLMQRVGRRAPEVLQRLSSLNQYVFFIYAVHTVLLVNWARGIVFRIPALREEGSGALLGYFLIGALTLTFSFACYAVMKKVAPRVLSILSGGR